MKKLRSPFLNFCAAAGFVGAAFTLAVPIVEAANVTTGNPAVNRSLVDTYSNFTIIDSNFPVSGNGWLTNFSYYAANTNPFEFVLVDTGNIVKWISPTITPAGTGLQTYAINVPVQNGWNLGVHFDSTGTIPFDYMGAPATYTPNNNGMPVVGAALAVEGTSNRVYSWSGNGTDVGICSPITLKSDANTQTAGWTASNPEANPLDPTLYSLPSWANAVAASLTPTGYTLIPGPWTDPTTGSFAGSGAVWINSIAAAPGDVGGEGLGTTDQWRLFKQEFSVPAGASVSPITVYFTADNGASAYFNGALVGNTNDVDTFGPVPNPLPSAFATTYSAVINPVAGQVNTLSFVLRNSEYPITVNPTGLLYAGQGEYCVPTGTISGMKYNDLNRNGKKDVTEVGLQGWTINLEKLDGTIIASTVTALDGTYSFPNLAPGTYKLREVHQNGWKRMSKNPKPIVLIAGATVTDVNFGNAQKEKKEKEDTNKDDQRDDQSGTYYSGHNGNEYTKDENDKSHQSSSGHNDREN